MKDTHNLKHRFDYHKPGDEVTIKAHEDVRAAALKLARLIDRVAPEGREKSLAFTKIEEAMLWANAAIARDPQNIPRR